MAFEFCFLVLIPGNVAHSDTMTTVIMQSLVWSNLNYKMSILTESICASLCVLSGSHHTKYKMGIILYSFTVALIPHYSLRFLE